MSASSSSRVGEEHDRDAVLQKLVDSQYVRNDTVLGRGRFRVKGDVVEVQPANIETAYRVSFFVDEVEQIAHFDPLTGEVYAKLDNLVVWPATEYVTSEGRSSAPWTISAPSLRSRSRGSRPRVACSKRTGSGSGPSTTSR